MAYRKEILAGLKKKHKNAPKVVLDKVADHLETGVEEEDQVDSAVDGADGLVTMISGLVQTEGDRRAEEALKKNGIDPTKKPKGGDNPDDDDSNPKPGDDAPAWAKGLLETNKTLLAKVEALEQGKTIETRASKLEEILKEAEPSFKAKVLKDFKRMQFKDDAEFDEYLEDTGNDMTAFNQDLSNKGLGQQNKPILGNPNGQGVSSSVQAFIESKTNPDKSGDSSLGGKKI